MVMVREETLNSSRSPGWIPAWRRTLGGTTSSALFLTVTVIRRTIIAASASSIADEQNVCAING
jgi:hypothetical protein